MRLLFIHQNFPGQYLRLAQHLRDAGGHTIVGIGETGNIKNRGTIKGITTVGYPKPPEAGKQTHPYLRSTEAAVRRGQAVARTLISLKTQGFVPDVICAHPGWGEALFIREVYPQTPVALFCEFFFRAQEADLAFDPDYPQSADSDFSIRIRNAPQTLSLPIASACVSPTRWQANSYPDYVRGAMHIIHEGVDTSLMRPAAEAAPFLRIQRLAAPGESSLPDYPRRGPKEYEPDGSPPLVLTRGDKVITYVARNLEPYRGFHTFMRALPGIQKRHPDAHILIVGNTKVSYSPIPPGGTTYKRMYLDELGDKLDMSRVHFFGQVSYDALRQVFRIASAHIYLTYPFVLSWSVLEAMACEALVIGSATPPVEEVIRHNENGLLTDFFDVEQLVALADKVLSSPERYTPLRKAARRSVVENFELRACLAKQTALLHDLAAGKYPIPR